MAPITFESRPGFPINPQVFYLYTGLTGQARALLTFAAEELPDMRLAIVGEAAAAQRVLRIARSSLRREPVIVGNSDRPKALALRLQASGASVALGIDPLAVASLIAARAHGWPGEVLAPGSLLPRAGPGAFGDTDHRILLAYPHPAGNAAQAGLENLQAWTAAHGLPDHHRAVQAAALVGGRLSVEGLRRAGRDLSRARLIVALEGIRELETGTTPPVTYGPNRRTGIRGAAIIEYNALTGDLVPRRGWQSIRVDG